MHFMVEKLILDNIWGKLHMQFPLGCAVGPEGVVGEPE